MANMSYCRFENTCPDLRDCYEAMGDPIEELSTSERKYRERIIEMCRNIVADYGQED